MALNYEFIHLYYALTDAERKSFRLYVKKNHSLKEKNIETLLYLESTKGEIKNFEKDKLLKRLKFKTDISRKLGNQMSELYSKCHEWLLLEAYKGNVIDTKLLLLQLKTRRNFNEKAYQKWNGRVAKELNKVPYRDANYHYLSWLQTHHSVFNASFNHVKDDSKEVLLNQAEEELDSFYALTKLRYYYERIAIGQIKNTKKNKFTQTEIATFSEKQLTAPSPLFRFFANIIQAFLSKDNSFYNTALELLSQYDHTITPSDLPSYYVCLSNYAIKKFNEENGAQRFFDLQVLGLDRNWITGGGQITSTLFLNIVNTGCFLGEIDLVHHVIDNYGSKIPKEYQVGSLIFAKARVHFAKKEFSLAIEKLRTIPRDFELSSFLVQSLLVRCYYELRKTDWETAKTFCINFKRNIKNTKGLSKSNQLRFLNFATFTLKLFREKVDWEGLYNEIEGTEALTCKGWLLEKVGEGIEP